MYTRPLSHECAHPSPSMTTQTMLELLSTHVVYHNLHVAFVACATCSRCRPRRATLLPSVREEHQDQNHHTCSGIAQERADPPNRLQAHTSDSHADHLRMSSV